MSKEIERYNTELHLFEEAPKPVNRGRLLFMRWLAARNLLEHPVAGPPQGDLALFITAAYGRDSLKPKSKTEQLREHISRTGGY